jgi:adenylyltransferase/sulfurtransferase
MYLAAAGVGVIGLVDGDVVEVSNLQRQVVHGTGDVGRLKVDSARDRLASINPEVQVVTHPFRLTVADARAVVSDYDVVVDGTDNFPARYLINDVCVLLGKPMVYGSVFRFEGQVGVFDARRGACYRCLYPSPPPAGLVPNCAEAGVLGVLPGIVGCLQANEAIKLILGIGEPLIDRLLLVDALTLQFRTLHHARDPACPVCGTQPRITTLSDLAAETCFPVHQPKESDSMQQITAVELKQRLDRGDVDLVDVREPHEYAVAKIPGARLIPLATVVAERGQLNPARETVVMCRGGARSAKAIDDLRKAGYTGTLINLAGGITAWSNDVDPSVPKY